MTKAYKVPHADGVFLLSKEYRVVIVPLLRESINADKPPCRRLLVLIQLVPTTGGAYAPQRSKMMQMLNYPYIIRDYLVLINPLCIFVSCWNSNARLYVSMRNTPSPLRKSSVDRLNSFILRQIVVRPTSSSLAM
jgi:hypothetical protein